MIERFFVSSVIEFLLQLIRVTPLYHSALNINFYFAGRRTFGLFRQRSPDTASWVSVYNL